MVAAVVNDDALRGRDEVLDVLDNLLRELEAGSGWENDTLSRFLDAFNALLGSIENVYPNTGRPVPSSPWSLVAEALKGARSYE